MKYPMMSWSMGGEFPDFFSGWYIALPTYLPEYKYSVLISPTDQKKYAEIEILI